MPRVDTLLTKVANEGSRPLASIRIRSYLSHSATANASRFAGSGLQWRSWYGSSSARTHELGRDYLLLSLDNLPRLANKLAVF
jgi:hypothetical protein